MGKKELYSRREIRGAVLLMPLLMILLVAGYLAREEGLKVYVRPQPSTPDSLLRIVPFDPNEVTYEQLREMGLRKWIAHSIIKYRAAGKVFRIPEDVATCYGISDSLYQRMKPYIIIGERYRYKPRTYRPTYERDTLAGKRPLLAPTTFRIDTVGVAYLRAIGALTKRQAEVFVRWRDLRGIYDLEELKECYTVSDSVADALAPYIIFPERKTETLTPDSLPVNLNRADTATLRRLYGIGAKTAANIVRYRENLGGFYRKEQLSEVPGINEANYEKILTQIFVDSCDISKIDINFAPSSEIGKHPYVSPRSLRRILKQRQLKGGWSTAEEFYKDDILKEEERERLRPYLLFGTSGGTKTR